MELLYFIGGKMSKKFASLKRLKMSNTERLEQLKANLGIESVVLENSKILSISTFVKRVPPPLLSRNNMANYTQVKVNNVLLAEAEIEKLKIGKMNVENNDTIEVIDGILAGTIFTIKLGLPLNTMIKDPVLLTHVKELLGKESITSDVSKYELDNITWIGKDPSQITENSYLGYFNAKTIGNFEIFKKDLEWFPNLKYVNLSGSIFADSVSLSDFPGIDTFNYSFADCVVLQSIVIDKNVKNFEGALRNCQNLRTVTINDVEVLGADKSFHNCKGIRNLTVANPNMVDQRTLNAFSEAIVSEVTFNGEPTDNVITSNILLDAIASSITIDLTGKKRPDLYNLISTPNNLAERLILNNTNILELDLTKPTHNFLNLRQILAENTEDLRKIKLAGNNIQVLNLNNSSGIYLQIAEHETPAIFIDNAAYYNRIEINSVELDPLQVLELKKGNWVFNNNDIAKILDGPLANYLLEVSDGIIPTRISKMFPDEILADYIRFKTNKETINDKVRQGEIDSIVYFGSEGIVTDITTPSWFNGKVVDSFEGLDQLRNLKSFYIKGISGAFNSITLLTSKMTSLFGAFYGTTALNNINVVGNLDLVEDISHIFEANTAITNIDFLKNNLQNVKRMKNAFKDCSTLVSANISSATNVIDFTSAFENCPALSSVNLPVSLSNTTSIKLIFKGNVRLSSITLPSVLESLNDMSSAFEGCTLLSTLSGFLNLNALGNMNRAFYGCESLTSITLPRQLPALTTAVDAFNSAIELRSLYIEGLPLVVDISGIVMNTPKLTVIKLDPLLTNCLSTLESTGLDLPGKNIVYSANPDIIYYNQIKYHDENSYPEYQNATLNYSALTNLRPLIRKIFPCPTVAEYIALQLNKSVNDSILIEELHTIQWFGTTNLTNSSVSWFSGKTINSFEGIQHLINVKSFSLFNVSATPSSIDLTNFVNLESLNNGFRNCLSIKNIIFPTEMPSLRLMERAFNNAVELVSLRLPIAPLLETLNEGFQLCGKLETVVFSEMNSLKTLNGAFFRCSMLTSVTFPETLPNLENGSSIFKNCEKLITVNIPSMPKVNTLQYMFDQCHSIASIEFKELPLLDSLAYAFENCKKLEVVKFQQLPLLRTLYYTFKSCDLLNTIELPPLMPTLASSLGDSYLDKAGRTIIYLADPRVETKAQIKYHNGSNPMYVFTILDYSRLPDLKLAISEYFPCPTIAEYIGIKLNKTVNDPVSKSELATVPDLGNNGGGWDRSWFYGKTISSFEGIEHLTGIKSICLERSDYTGSLGSVVLDLRFATQLEELYNAFQYCSYLKEVILADSLPKLRSTNRIFEACTYLDKITLPTYAPLFDSAHYMFGGCSRLIEVEFNGVWKEGMTLRGAFERCPKLTRVVLPTNSNLTDSLADTFSGCSSLVYVENLFEYYPNVIMTQKAFYNTSSLTIEGTNGIIPKNFPKSWTTESMYAYSALPTGDITFDIPESGDASYMFMYSKNLTNVNINASNKLTKIFQMFRSSSAINITFNNPIDVTSGYGGKEMFAYCRNLMSVSFAPGTLISGLESAFSQCEKMQELNLRNVHEISNIYDFVGGCYDLTKIIMEPKQPYLVTPIIQSMLDKVGRTIKFAKDDSVTVKSQIFYHDKLTGDPLFTDSTLDYSELNLYPDGSFFSFFNNLELATHVAEKFGLTAADIMEDAMMDIVTEIGGALAMPSQIKGNITDWNFIEKLPNLQFINLSGNTNVQTVDLSKAKCLLEVRNSLRACSSLTEVKLPVDCSYISNFTYMLSNTTQEITVHMPAILPSATTLLENTGFDREGITIVYYEDLTITTIAQITYFPTLAIADCSALKNCGDAPMLLFLKDYITTNLKIDDSNMKNSYLKDTGFFYNKVTLDNQVTQGFIEITEPLGNFSGFGIDIEASVSSERTYDSFNVFITKAKISSINYTPSQYDIPILQISGTVNKTKYWATVPKNDFKYIYFCYRKDSSGSTGEDRGKIHSIKINKLSAFVIDDKVASEVDYITDNQSAIPTSLMNDPTMESVAINGKTMHPTVVEQIKNGEFKMPKYGVYDFKPLSGKYKDINFKCNYKENMFEDDVIEAEIVK